MHGATQAFDDSDAVLLRESKVAAHDAGRVHAWVKSILEGSKAAEKAYAFKHRLKPFDEIFAKVRAKRNHEDPALRKPGYGVADLTDISGFRIVSLFNAEIPVALGRLLDLLKTPIPAGSPGAFLPVPDEAPLIAASEIQLRSVFEEAWSEVNHRLKYAPAKRERARGGIAADVAGEEAAVLQHLDALKSLTDGCGQYADLINLDLTSRRERRGDRLPQPTESAEALLRSFRGCSPDVYGKVKQAFELRTEATAAARSVSENPVGAPTRDKQAVLPRRPSLRGGIRSNSVRGARYTAAREPRGHPPSRNGVLLLVLRQQRAAASS
jgi:hypothetical protein